MRKANVVKFGAIIFLTMGITYLNFENLNFQDNVKAYISLAIGGVLGVFILFKWWQFRTNK